MVVILILSTTAGVRVEISEPVSTSRVSRKPFTIGCMIIFFADLEEMLLLLMFRLFSRTSLGCDGGGIDEGVDMLV